MLLSIFYGVFLFQSHQEVDCHLKPLQLGVLVLVDFLQLVAFSVVLPLIVFVFLKTLFKVISDNSSV